MKVIKRDGTPQEYNFIKIADAVTKAFNSILVIDKNLEEDEYLKKFKRLKENQQPEISKFLDQLKEPIEKLIIKNNGNGTEIEEIQDCIQKELIKRNKYEVVEAFINYRRKREEEREKNSDLIKAVQEKLFAKHVINQNANLDEESFGGRVGEAASVVCKREALKMMSKTSRRNHEKNIVSIHDLDAYADGRHNCLTYPMDKSLSEGVITRQTDVRKAGSVNTAMQLTAVYFQLQSLQQFGGVSAGHIDWTMVPYIRKSYEKHYLIEYIKTLQDFYELDILGMTHKELNHWVENKITEFFLKTKLKDSDFYFDNKNVDNKLRQRALLETKKETYQAVEGMYHNLNTLQSRSGNQLPFSSINYGTCTEPEGRMLIKALLEVSMDGLGTNGVTSIFPCGIFQYKKGVNDKPGTPNYDLKRLALKSTAMRIYPNYANCDWSNQVSWFKQDRQQKQEYIDSLNDHTYVQLVSIIKDEPKLCLEKVGLYVDDNDNIKVDMTERPIEYFSTMGCRTINGLDINALDNFKSNVNHILNDEFDKIDDIFSGAQKDGRGNICPVTIILPTLALLAKQKFDKKHEDSKTEYVANYNDGVFNEFMKILEKKIEEAKDTLIERFNHICAQSWKSGKYMYENHTMAGYHEDEGIISALKHGTIVIGQLGLAEALQIMFKFDHTSKQGMEYAKKIEQLFLDKTSEYKKNLKLNFGVYYTPAVSLCGTAMNNFKRLNPGFEQENVTYIINKNGDKEEKKWFTNSIHVPVQHKCDPFEKIDIESQLTGYSNAGCITYTELDEQIYNNIDAIEKIVDYAMEHDIPYFAINVKIAQCHKCHERIWDMSLNECPKCGSNKIDMLGRVTGYLSTTVEHFNRAKQDEFRNRKLHTSNSILNLD